MKKKALFCLTVIFILRFQVIAEEMEYFTYKIVRSFPHNESSFTQGLIYDDGFFYEGTGLYGQSTLMKISIKSGKVLMMKLLPSHFFGEGIAIEGDYVFQLTWKAGILIKYEKKNFKEIKRFQYKGEGWGLTSDGTHLIMTSGTDRIDFLTTNTFRLVRSVYVRKGGNPLRYLNEIEYIKGKIYANIWGSDCIVKIDPFSGNVIGMIDLTDLYPLKERKNTQNVLNGIAYDRKNDRLFVTGKRWPRIFEIKLELKNKE